MSKLHLISLVSSPFMKLRCAGIDISDDGKYVEPTKRLEQELLN